MAADPTPSSENRSERHFVLTGYSENRTSGVTQVVIFDRRARIRRAGKGLAASWGAALVSVFIPVAHFILVPGFAVAGLVVLWIRLRAGEKVESVHGTCPDCGFEQDFDPPGAWSPPVSLACHNCGRTLTAG
ncbi:MAG: hypothetical protein O7E49_14075 [Gemmatimonadetes bacterium]|nr:hypothetical protein [Gemmatimonadota bacterium]